MKKTILALSISTLAITAGAQVTGVAEYDYDRVNGGGHSNYGAAGLVFQTKFGSFDGYVQGVNVHSNSVRDDSTGVELGYSKKFALGPVNVTPRIAYGTLSGMYGSGEAKYMLYSAEVEKQLNQNVSGFVGFSHQNGMTQSAVSASNRVLVGADYALTEKVALRVAYSHRWEQNQKVNGVMTAVSYSF